MDRLSDKDILYWNLQGREGCRQKKMRPSSEDSMFRFGSQLAGAVGLDPLKYATHSMRRTKATLIYRRNGNLRAVQLLLGHLKIESTVSAIPRRRDR